MLIWQETDRPLAERLRAYADLIKHTEAIELLEACAKALDNHEVFANFFWKFCPDPEAYEDILVD